MKKSSMLAGLMCLLAGGLLVAQAPVSRCGKGYDVSLMRGEGEVQRITFTLGDYRLEDMRVDGQVFTRFCTKGRVVSQRKGYAELPFFHAALQVKPDQTLRAVVESEEHQDIALAHPMVPSRGCLYRSQDPKSVPYEVSQASLREGFYPAQQVIASKPFLYRDVKGQNFYFNAVQYHAASQTLRVTKRMTVRLEPCSDQNAEALALLSRANVRPTVEMDATYQHFFMNYVPAKTRWPNELGDMGDILVVVTDRTKEAMKPYVEWKKQNGFNVEVKEIPWGTNAKDAVKAAYEANKKLLYVQLVGDWLDIKVPVGGGEEKPIDPVIGCITDDPYPELIVGRFSAYKDTDAIAMVNKTIAYEKDQTAPDDWAKLALGIASSEGGEGKGDDGESDIEHMSTIRDGRLKPAGYTMAEAFGDGTSVQVVLDAWNKGLSVVNYAGHGNEVKWGTTGFGLLHAKQLTNGHKAPIVCSVACLVGSYQKPTCLAEALLRNPNGGAVAGMFSSISQPWEAPMRGQDYFNDMVVGGHQYKNGKEKGTDTDHGKSTFGAMATNACVLMYAESGQPDDLKTMQTWINFGDVSLRVQKPKLQK